MMHGEQTRQQTIPTRGGDGTVNAVRRKIESQKGASITWALPDIRASSTETHNRTTPNTWCVHMNTPPLAYAMTQATSPTE